MTEPLIYDLGRPGRTGVHMPAPDVPLTPIPPHLVRERSQAACVHLRHVRKAWPESLVVGSGQRIDPHQIDVVVNDHEVTNGEVRVDPAGRVRQDDRLDARRPAWHHVPHT